jgi:hypothetical protein
MSFDDEMRIQTGAPLVSGVVKPGKIAQALGLRRRDEVKRDGRPKLTPAQVRAAERGEVLPDAPGYKTTTVSGGRDVAEFLGEPVGVPLGQGAEGQPLPPEPPRREDTAPQRSDWESADRVMAKRDLARQMAAAEKQMEALLRKEAELES